MSSTKKGNAWYFGSEADRKLIRRRNVPTNAQIGVDTVSGMVHSLDSSTARLHCTMPASGTRCCTARRSRSGPSCHWRRPCQRRARGGVQGAGPGKAWGVRRKAPKGSLLDPLDEPINHIIAMVRARVEQPFRVIKRQSVL